MTPIPGAVNSRVKPTGGQFTCQTRAVNSLANNTAAPRCVWVKSPTKASAAAVMTTASAPKAAGRPGLRLGLTSDPIQMDLIHG
jgi:hypothetical protein